MADKVTRIDGQIPDGQVATGSISRSGASLAVEEEFRQLVREHICSIPGDSNNRTTNHSLTRLGMAMGIDGTRANNIIAAVRAELEAGRDAFCGSGSGQAVRIPAPGTLLAPGPTPPEGLPPR